MYMILDPQFTAFPRQSRRNLLSLSALRSVDSITEVVINFHLFFLLSGASGGRRLEQLQACLAYEFLAKSKVIAGTT